MNIELRKRLAVLELGDLAAVIENQEKDVSLVDLNYNDRLEHLLTELITERQNRLIGRLTKNAELKYQNASLETLDCEERGINRDTIVNLASMGFVSTATNLIITGETGAGKTYLSCVLGVEACKQTLRTVISECLICWGIFKITKIISESWSGIEKDLEITRF